MKEAGRFLRLLAHDLQNQAGAVDLNLQILPSVLPEEFANSEFILRAMASSRDLLAVIEDIQYFARAASREDDAEAVPLVSCDLSTKVRDCALSLQASAVARRVTLRAVATEDVHALGESDSIRRTIQILTSEAIRSAFPESTVEMIVTSKPVPTIEITVSVEGIFEEARTTLATYLAKAISRSSNVTMLLRSDSGISRVQLLFQPA
jgi:signal transduction histidine kinase